MIGGGGGARAPYGEPFGSRRFPAVLQEPPLRNTRCYGRRYGAQGTLQHQHGSIAPRGCQGACRGYGARRVAYVTAAVRRQMEEDSVVARRFASTDAAISATEAMPAPAESGEPFDEAEIAAARAGIAEALARSSEGAA